MSDEPVSTLLLRRGQRRFDTYVNRLKAKGIKVRVTGYVRCIFRIQAVSRSNSPLIRERFAPTTSATRRQRTPIAPVILRCASTQTAADS